MLKNVNDDDGRRRRTTTDHGYTISSTSETPAQVSENAITTLVLSLFAGKDLRDENAFLLK